MPYYIVPWGSLMVEGNAPMFRDLRSATAFRKLCDRAGNKKDIIHQKRDGTIEVVE